MQQQRMYDDEYNAGIDHFENGGTVRQMVEPWLVPPADAAAADRFDRYDVERDARQMSFALGYLDAALKRLREFTDRAAGDASV